MVALFTDSTAHSVEKRKDIEVSDVFAKLLLGDFGGSRTVQGKIE